MPCHCLEDTEVAVLPSPGRVLLTSACRFSFRAVLMPYGPEQFRVLSKEDEEYDFHSCVE